MQGKVWGRGAGEGVGEGCRGRCGGGGAGEGVGEGCRGISRYSHVPSCPPPHTAELICGIINV